MQSIRLNYPPKHGHGGYVGWIDDDRKKISRHRHLDGLEATGLGCLLYVHSPVLYG